MALEERRTERSMPCSTGMLPYPAEILLTSIAAAASVRPIVAGGASQRSRPVKSVVSSPETAGKIWRKRRVRSDVVFFETAFTGVWGDGDDHEPTIHYSPILLRSAWD